MRRVLCLLTLVMTVTLVHAQRGQDFASKYIGLCKGDSSIQCVTVSPKMVEQLLKSGDYDNNESIKEALTKLKSVRVITVTDNGKDYYERAENLLKKNARRFHQDKAHQTGQQQRAFYTRKDKKGNPVELVMLYNNNEAEKTIIVNLTGTLDEGFIRSVARHFEKKREFSKLSNK